MIMRYSPPFTLYSRLLLLHLVLLGSLLSH